MPTISPMTDALLMARACLAVVFVLAAVGKLADRPGLRVTLGEFFDGCPNHDQPLPRLRELLDQAGVSTEVELVKVPSDDAAQRARFLGSPTLRVDRRDVEPGADTGTDFGLKCLPYRTADGLAGAPPDDWVRGAVERSNGT